MIDMMLSQASRAVEGHLEGSDLAFTGVATDTRRSMNGALFIALEGERFDAHEYVNDALSQGAAGLLVHRALDVDAPQIRVPDTRAGLGALAQAWRAGFTRPLVAITGSNGKTTVKQMVASILTQMGRVHATRGNLNNDIGVPLTLLELDRESDYAVIEMGANHPGEIAYLVAMAQPDAALITNAGPAHLEGFGSLEGVARAKGEIFEGLPQGATAVINADDDYADYWLKVSEGHPITTFGLDAPEADVTGEVLEEGFGTCMRVNTELGAVELDLPLGGRHNVRNALAATALCISVGATLEAVKSGLENVENVGGRLKKHEIEKRNLTLIDDTYNANPGSVRAAIDLLSGLARSEAAQSWLVLGDMGELGADAAELHAELGSYARDKAIDHLVTCGPLSAGAAERFGRNAHAMTEVDDIVELLQTAIDPAQSGRTAVLVKGSRAMRMERVVDTYLARHREENN